jgi:hypothetical protein
VVETINRLMLFATGKHSVWDKKQTPPWEPDGTPAPRDKRYWLPSSPPPSAFCLCLGGCRPDLPDAAVPGLFRHGLFTLSLRGEVIFLSAATTVLTFEFLFARHLFCRYACAVGIFQSFAWIGNKKAMVVGFERERLTDCANCLNGNGSACDAVCPMRLKPRNVKRWMFACTQCGQCISACGTVNRSNPNGQLLRWVSDEARPTQRSAFSALKHRRRRRWETEIMEEFIGKLWHNWVTKTPPRSLSASRSQTGRRRKDRRHPVSRLWRRPRPEGRCRHRRSARRPPKLAATCRGSGEKGRTGPARCRNPAPATGNYRLS